MEKNDNKELFFKRLNDRAESIRLLTEFYEDEEQVSFYTYDLIAYLLRSESSSSKLDYNDEIQRIFLEIIDKTKVEDEGKIYVQSLKNLLTEIDKYKFSTMVLSQLIELYSNNENLINIDYKLNSNNISKSIRKQLNLESEITKLKIIKIKKFLISCKNIKSIFEVTDYKKNNINTIWNNTIDKYKYKVNDKKTYEIIKKDISALKTYGLSNKKEEKDEKNQNPEEYKPIRKK